MDSDPFGQGFGMLRVLDEVRLLPGAALTRFPGDDVEIVTYVREGAVAYRDSTGRSGVLQAGEFRCMTGRHKVQYSEANASRTDSAHMFRIGLEPSRADAYSRPEQRRFSTAQRRGELCLVASADMRAGSLRIYQDAQVYSALLHAGQHVIHELGPGRRAWLHLVQGNVALEDLVLTTGDGASASLERALSFRAREETEILVVEVAGFGSSAAVGVA